MVDIFITPVYTREAPRRLLAAPGYVTRDTASPTGIPPVGVAAAPGSMAIAKAPEASGDFCMLAYAARNPPNPNCTQLKQTRGVCLSQPNHCRLHPTKAGEEPAKPVKCWPAQCQAQGRINLFFFNGLVEVPNFEGPRRDKGRNFCLLPDRPVEFFAEGRNVSRLFEDLKDFFLPGTPGRQDLKCCLPGIDFRLHFLQDVGVGLAVLRRHLDGVARPGGRGALRLRSGGGLLRFFRRVPRPFLPFFFLLFFSFFFSFFHDHMPVRFFIWGLARGHLSIRARRPTLSPLGSYFQRGRGRRSFFALRRIFCRILSFCSFRSWSTSFHPSAPEEAPKSTSPTLLNLFSINIFYQRIVRRGAGMNSWGRVYPRTKFLPQFPEAQPPLSRSRNTRTDRTRSKQHRLRHLCSIRTT